MTVITSTALIVITAICLRSRKIFLSIGYKLLAVLIVLTLIRFLCPIEVSFVRNIVMPKALSLAVSSIRHTFFSIGKFNISIWFLLECIWYGGILYSVTRMILSYIFLIRFINRYGDNVTEKEPYASIMTRICDGRKNTFRICRLPNLDTARQSGAIHPCIMIPAELELSEEELYYTLYHEFIHYRHHDFLIKLGMNLLSAIYWWNPLCRILAKQLDLLQEIRVDEAVTGGDQEVQTAYYKVLETIGEQLMSASGKPTSPTYLTAPRATGSIADLRRRAEMIFYYKKAFLPVFLSLLLLVLGLFIGSYCFTFEAYYVAEQDELKTTEVTPDEMYAILLDDGTYDIYWDGWLIEHVDSIEYYYDITVIESK
ncbi:MAG: M56 family metallopeptidase [Roseburia sp.]|nr:M56 family metallopeptidase [Roseburia sp.]MCM1098614.1 M56 family metallopeptidase [Ruminococcus flavefaciens]